MSSRLRHHQCHTENHSAKKNNVISSCSSLRSARPENFPYVLCYHRPPQQAKNSCSEEKREPQDASQLWRTRCAESPGPAATVGSWTQIRVDSGSAARAASREDFTNSGEIYWAREGSRVLQPLASKTKKMQIWPANLKRTGQCGWLPRQGVRLPHTKWVRSHSQRSPQGTATHHW